MFPEYCTNGTLFANRKRIDSKMELEASDCYWFFCPLLGTIHIAIKITQSLKSVHCGPLIALFSTSGDVCPQFQRHLHALSLVSNGFLRFTSGATSADLLADSM